MTGVSKPRSHVLVCEDDHATALTLRSILEGSGYTCDIAETAAQARELLANGRYAAMTLDVMLPDTDGVAFLRELRGREATSGLPVVVVSVKTRETPGAIEGGVVGVLDWLGKPASPKRLLAAIRMATRSATRRGAAGPPRVLHVEDDPDVRRAVAAILHGVAEVREAASLKEARQELARETFDLALLDLRLPDGYGLELTRLLSAKDPPIPVVVFSVTEPRRRRDADELAAVLVKSQSSAQQLVDAIAAQISAAESGATS